MAKKEHPVTLDMVRGAAEAAAREHNCSIQDLTNPQVRPFMPHGSDGCLAAFLRQLKIEDLDTQKFDFNDFSPGFKATIVSEIRRFVENAVEAERMEARVTGEMFGQSCRDLDAAQETIDNLQGELASSTSKTADEIRRLELDLSAARERLAGAEEVKATLTKGRDAAILAQNEAREEVTRLTGRLAEATSELSAERSRASNLHERLAESEREREAAAQKAALSEQRAAHVELTAEDQKERMQDLRDEIVEMKAERNKLQTRVSELQENLGKAETRAAVAEARFSTEGKKPQSHSGATAERRNAQDTKGRNGKARS